MNLAPGLLLQSTKIKLEGGFSFFLCHKAACKWVEIDKGYREGILKLVQERLDEVFIGICYWRFGKKKALLDIVCREHGKIPWCQV